MSKQDPELLMLDAQTEALSSAHFYTTRLISQAQKLLGEIEKAEAATDPLDRYASSTNATNLFTELSTVIKALAILESARNFFIALK